MLGSWCIMEGGSTGLEGLCMYKNTWNAIGNARRNATGNATGNASRNATGKPTGNGSGNPIGDKGIGGCHCYVYDLPKIDGHVCCKGSEVKDVQLHGILAINCKTPVFCVSE